MDLPCGRKMRCNIFLQKVLPYFFHGDSFCKKRLAAWYCRRIFLTTELYFLFFIFFLWLNLRLRHQKNLQLKTDLLIMTSFKAVGRNGKDSGVAHWTWKGDTRLCAVTEVYRRQRKAVVQQPKSEWRLYTGGTWEGVGKRGKHFAEKWCFASESGFENREPRRNCNRRWERQRYGGCEENALSGNFQHAPQTHYKS